MGGMIKPLRHFSKKADPLYKLNAGAQIGESLAPDIKTPDVPSPPTVDEAARTRQSTDRLRRRKGVLANIFAGGTAAAPSVGKSTLGG